MSTRRRPDKSRSTSPRDAKSMPKSPITSEEFKLLAHKILETKATHIKQTAFDQPWFKTSFPNHTRSEISFALDAIIKVLNLTDDDLTYAVVAGALLSQAKFFHDRETEEEKDDAKLQKLRAERIRIEEDIDRARKESHFLSKESQREKVEREKIAQQLRRRQVQLEMRRDKYQEEVTEVSSLYTEVDRVKMADLEVRRKIDRLRLKVGAMRGEMVTPTVDKICRPDPRDPEYDAPLYIKFKDPIYAMLAKADEDAPDLSSGADLDLMDHEPSLSGDMDTPFENACVEVDEDAEETQLRLLKNRLAMCETEAREWKNMLEDEKMAVVLAMKGKQRVEDEIARRRPGSGKGGISMRGKGLRTGPKGKGKVVSSWQDPRKEIRKRKKAIPCRSLD